MAMAPRLRKFALTAHVTSSVGWLGAVAGFLALAIPGLASQDAETVRFVTAAGQGNLRLLMGMVRANRPWRLIAGLSRALVGALGAGAFGLTSPAMWQIALSQEMGLSKPSWSYSSVWAKSLAMRENSSSRRSMELRS